MTDMLTAPANAHATPSGRMYLNPLRDPSPEYLSVTRVINAGVPKQLDNWFKKVTAEYAVDHLDAWQALERDAAVDVIKAQADRIRDDAGDRGSIVHHILRAHVDGTQPDPVWDAEVAPYVAAGMRFLDEWQPQIVWCEVTVYSDRWLYAGTLDLAAVLPGLGLTLLDWKSGKGVYPETALQLAAYRHAEYAVIDDQEVPLPPFTAGAVVHLRPDGTYSLVPYECGDRQFDLFLNAVQVARFTGIEGRTVMGEPLPAPSLDTIIAERARWMATRVQVLRDEHPGAIESLAACWPAGVPTLKQGGHTLAQLDVIGEAIGNVEAAFGVPFPPPDPTAAAAPAELRDAIKARAERLPADLLEQVSAEAKAAGIAHITSPLFSRAHAERLEPILAAAEADTNLRLEWRRQLAVDLLDGDTQLHALIIDTIGNRHTPPTASDLDVYRALAEAVAAGAVAPLYADNAAPVLAALDGEKRLVAAHGSKATALAVCRDIAGRFGRPTPRSVAAAAGDTVLTALALSTSITNAQHTQEKAS